MADKKIAEQYYSPPVKMGKWEGFKTFLWNSETSQCLGRTGGSWAKILFFYLVFYAVLTGFFAALLAVFYQTLRLDKPKWTLENGMIGSNPGLGFRPMPPEANVESTLIWYDTHKPDNYNYWVEETARFLKSYDDLNKKNHVNCSFENVPPAGKVCGIDVQGFAPCTLENKFGYSEARPCIFLKLNKIYSWEPEIYNDSKALPGHMPEELKQHIKDKQNLRPNEVNVVWISCEGENPADVENIKARDYYPRMGFPQYYFPFENIDGYVPPIVAVQFSVERIFPRHCVAYFFRFEDNVTTICYNLGRLLTFERHISLLLTQGNCIKFHLTGVLINIECKAWARNIHHDRHERRGSVHFELMVD